MSEITIPCPTWKEVKPWLWRAIILGLSLYIAYLVREIWLPLGIAFLVALVLDPVVDRLERRGWSRMWGAALIFAIFLIGVVGLSLVSVPIVVNQASDIQKRIDTYLPDRSPAGINKKLKEQGVAPGVREFVVSAVTNVEKSLDQSGNVIATKALELGTNLTWVAIIPIIAFYALKDFHLILAKMLLIVKPRRRELVQSAVSEITAIFAKYMRGLLLVSGLNGVATWLLLLALQVPSSFVLGLVAGLLYMVPYIGAIVTVLLIAIIAFLSGGVSMMLWAVILSVLLHQVLFDQIITPKIVGGQVGLHPILAIISLLIGQALLGLIGMILAVPIAACIQIAILAMMPKLKQEIDLDSIHEHAKKAIAEDSKDRQLAVDSTEELNDSVNRAIQHLEERLPVDEAYTVEEDPPARPKVEGSKESATVQIHKEIGQIVSEVETKVEEEQERKAKIMNRRKNRADGSGR